MQRFLSHKSALMSMSAYCAALAALMGGCPSSQMMGDDMGGGMMMDDGQQQGQPSNHAPAVSAGADQQAKGGEAVALAAVATDADGDPLTYEWTQTGGAAVTLDDATSAAPSFTAPLASGALTFKVTVSDGQASATDTVAIDVSVAPLLFVSNFSLGTGGGVVGYEDPASVNGNIAPDVNLFGGATQIEGPTDIVVDAAGALVVANFATNSIRCYDDATHANGNFAPERNIVGGATQLASPTSMAIDVATDALFVSNYGGAPDSIALFADASSASFNGNLAPTRVITSAAIANPTGINLDSEGSLYVVNNAAVIVSVFADADNLNGPVAPSRQISSADFAGHPLFDIFVDREDRLYALSLDGRVFMFDHASTLNGPAAPDRTLQITGAVQTTAIVVDAAGVGYIVDKSTQAIYSFDGIAALNAALLPDRSISGASTQLDDPIRLYLLER